MEMKEKRKEESIGFVCYLNSFDLRRFEERAGEERFTDSSSESRSWRSENHVARAIRWGRAKIAAVSNTSNEGRCRRRKVG